LNGERFLFHYPPFNALTRSLPFRPNNRNALFIPSTPRPAALFFYPVSISFSKATRLRELIFPKDTVKSDLSFFWPQSCDIRPIISSTNAECVLTHLSFSPSSPLFLFSFHFTVPLLSWSLLFLFFFHSSFPPPLV